MLKKALGPGRVQMILPQVHLCSTTGLWLVLPVASWASSCITLALIRLSSAQSGLGFYAAWKGLECFWVKFSLP